MMRRPDSITLPSLAALCLLAAGCSQAPDPQEDAQRDEEAIAAVEAAQVPPVIPVTLDVISFPDIERENLFGAGCNFAPDGGGIGAVAIAQNAGGYLKVDGRIERFAPDVGSPEIPYGARQRYTSVNRSFELNVRTAERQGTGYETESYRARLLVRDARDRQVFGADGVVQCGA